MATYSADAIVIRSREYGESDRLLSLYARERGKIDVVAKGVRKPKSKQRGGTQLFTYADFMLYKGKTLDTVNQVQPLESFMHIWDDFDRIIAASSMAELLDIATIKEQPDSELFTLTISFLFLLKHVDPYLAQAAYALRLMKLQGYLPAFNQCAECGKPFAGEQAFLSAESGGVLCNLCKKNKIVSSLNPGSLKLMEQLLKVDLGKLDRLRWNNNTKEEILGGLCPFCEEKFERKLKAWRH